MLNTIYSLELDEPTDREKCIGVLRGCLSTRPPDAINFTRDGRAMLSDYDGEVLGVFPIADLMEAASEA